MTRILPAPIQPYAADIVFSRPGEEWELDFANGFRAHVTKAGDGDWFLDVIVLVEDEEYPFLPVRQPISEVALMVGLAMLHDATYVARTIDESIARVQSIPALAPVQPFLHRLVRAVWLPTYVELVFDVGNLGVVVRWAPANDAVGLDTDSVMMEVREFRTDWDGVRKVGWLVQELPVTTIEEAAAVLAARSDLARMNVR
jgi:hypothetical protein